MNIYAIPPFITFILIVIEGYIVYFNDKRAKLNIVYSLFCLSLCIWLFGYCGMYLSKDPHSALFWARNGFFGIIFIPIFAYHFISAFLKIKKDWVLAFLYITSIPSLIVFRTNLVYKNVITHFWGYYPIAGHFYIFFLICFLIGFGGGVLRLILALTGKSGEALTQREKNQIKYLLFAFGIGTTGVVDYAIKFPFINIYPWGYLSAFGLITFFGLAIIKYQLLDIEVLIKKTLVFAGLFTSVFIIIGFVTFVLQNLLGKFIPISNWLSLGINIAILILLYDPIKKVLINITNKYLFQKEYDPQRLMKEISQGIVGKIDLESLRDFIAHVLQEKIKLENIAIIDEDAILSRWHMNSNAPLLYDAIDYMARRKKIDLSHLKNHMRELKASVSIPVFFKDTVFWFILLGDKKSGRTYSSEDIGLIDALSHEISVAIENVMNFQELKRSQMELLRQNNLEFVSVLVKGLAHEIFNPLMPLMHKIEDLEGEDLLKIYEIYEQNKAKLDKDDEMKFRSSLLSLRESTKSLKTNASHIHLIVDTLSKLEKGDEKTIGAVDIKSFFKEIVSLFGLEIEPNLQQGVVINQDITQNLPPVKANPTLLKQIFINLYKNSCYAMKNSPIKTINISCEISDVNQNEIKIVFSDTGSGISPDVISKIFSYGFTTKGSKGSGIGLNQCRAIIERFGGTISIESEKNKGTRIVIKVPIWEEGVKNVA